MKRTEADASTFFAGRAFLGPGGPETAKSLTGPPLLRGAVKLFAIPGPGGPRKALPAKNVLASASVRFSYLLLQEVHWASAWPAAGENRQAHASRTRAATLALAAAHTASARVLSLSHVAC